MDASEKQEEQALKELAGPVTARISKEGGRKDAKRFILKPHPACIFFRRDATMFPPEDALYLSLLRDR